MTQFAQPEVLPREQVWGHLLGMARAGDTETARLAQEHGQIELTDDERAELDRIAAEAQERTGDRRRLDFFAYGEQWGQRQAARWAYDRTGGGYHRWTGKEWINLSAPEGRDWVWRELMHTEQDAYTRTTIQTRGTAQVRKGIEAGISRHLPLVVEGVLAVDNGLVDLRTGAIRSFDPAIDSHRVACPASYRYDWTDTRCWNQLRVRMRPCGIPLLDDEGIGVMVEFLALAITGRAQWHSPILVLWGPSGAGKGGCLTLIARTLGGRAKGCDVASLKSGGGDIDATKAEILINDILVITVSEADAIAQTEMLANTGDNSWSKRMPHGELVHGTPRCMYIISSVDPPAMDMAGGFARRTGVIRFPEHENVAAGQHIIPSGYKAEPTQDEISALLTLAIRRAAAVYRTDYNPTQGNYQALAAFREAVDPLRAWLEDQHNGNDLEGRSIPALCEEFVDAEGRRGISHAKMRRAVKGLRYTWKKGNWSNGGYAQFVHRPQTDPDLHMPAWIAAERSRLTGKQGRDALLFHGEFQTAPLGQALTPQPLQSQ